MQKLGGLIRKSSNPPSLTLISLPCNNARVVVCFCEGRTVRGLLAAIRANKLEGLFHIMGRYGIGADYKHFPNKMTICILAMAGQTGQTSYRAWKQQQWVKFLSKCQKKHLCFDFNFPPFHQ